ncbi:uncharacterized protein J4E79_007927 [Alternaria viburni]|uniref:uncharacterized protein n=1 Tax=Alternaria viburni TaxID=566460 RepID=UPI0020C37A6E|nr:uncharacterized protein J4E79_007927 [Alternaria viburni]KAI4656374.1 hypothetical protein J4E79_007927 [Alternaria viburni]
MTSSPIDPVQQHIFNTLSPRRGAVPSHIIESMSSLAPSLASSSNEADLLPSDNIAFLIKFTAGPGILASQISIPVLDVRGPLRNNTGRRATICIHRGRGDFTVVLWAQVKGKEELMNALSDKVDKVIKDVLAHQEDDGSGDLMV